MDCIKYSAVIRATRYSHLINQTLESLLSQSVKPLEIIIVLPFGDNISMNIDEKNIKIAYSDRGMVAQRAKGIELASYNMLLCDADVILEKDVAEILLAPIEKGLAQCVVPYCVPYLKRTLIGKCLDLIFGIRIPKKNGGILVTRGGGFYVPTNELKRGYYYTEIGPGLVIGLGKEFAKLNRIMGDRRFEMKSFYAYLEDAALVMQVVNAGGKALITDKAKVIHLNEGITKRGIKNTFYYILLWNHYLFWKHYVYIRETDYIWKIISVILFIWTALGMSMIHTIFAIWSIKSKGSFYEIKSAIIGLINFWVSFVKEQIHNL